MSLEPAALILMGVAGSGKTTTASLLGERLGWSYRDADSFHPPANIEKMSRGEALGDEDRWPWLAAIGAWIDDHLARGESTVVTCSALKRVYRDRLVGGRPGAHLVHLVGEKSLIAGRMGARRDHFMPLGLLDSQFATLEPPAADERVLSVPVTQTPDEVVDAIVTALGLAPGGRRA
ncbi:MAG TPA: gluconokinase [Microvirga sp.]|jgi:gluconokinase|nr:gluconokinase [Microvirga sp.]